MSRPLGMEPSVIKVYEDESKRGYWDNKREFMLSCIGYATGIGNIWRFPYLCYRNGGGAFLIPYILMITVCGIPLYFLETSIGQFSSAGCLTMFKMSPIFKGLGYTIIIVNIICTSYYSLILTYPLIFITHTFKSVLPWSSCNNSWNTPNCVDISNENSNLYIMNPDISTPADEFFHNNVLQISSGIEDLGSIICPIFLGNLFSWFVICMCVSGGVQSLGKVVYFTATFPILVLVVLFGRGVTLPGAWTGIKFYIYPDWDQLTNLKVWSDAAVQVFYTLGPGWGGILNMASFNRFTNNNLKDSYIIPIINCVGSIFAGFCVFSVIGFLAIRTGRPIDDVVTAGPALTFITYPAAITMLPWSNLWGFLFFFMLFLVGINNVFVQLEAILSGISDEFPVLKKIKSKFAMICCAIMFFVSAICTTNTGMYIITLVDGYAATIPIIMVCFMELIMVGWVYGTKRFIYDIEFMRGKKVFFVWPILWKFICPAILLFMFITTIIWTEKVTYKGMAFPDWCEIFGWTICVLSMLCFPITMIYMYFKYTGSFTERFKAASKPADDWGPYIPKIAEEWRKGMNEYLDMKPDVESKSIQCSLAAFGKTMLTIGPKRTPKS